MDQYLTYYQLQKLSIKELYSLCLKENCFEEGGYINILYFPKSTLLEMLSVTRREWETKKERS